MKQRAYLGIDVGHPKCSCHGSRQKRRCARFFIRTPTSRRDGGRHEQSPLEWWKAVCAAGQATMQQVADSEIVGLAVAATSGTILLMDSCLTPLTAGLMYDDNRAIQEAIETQEVGHELWTRQSYRMQPSWALPKLIWLQRNGFLSAGAKLAHQNDYINAMLAGRVLATDSSNALKTGVDLEGLQWPHAIMEDLHIDPLVLPQVVLPGTRLGGVSAEASRNTGIPIGTPIFAGMTDGCAAQIASGATNVGSWNSVVGTTLVMKGVTERLLHDPLGVVYSHRSPDGNWLPGGASSTGAGFIAKHYASENLAALDAAAAQLGFIESVVYPLVGTGERYPFFAPDAQSFTLGAPATDAGTFTAVLQGLAFVERLAFDALHQIGADVEGRFTISGGAARSQTLSQIRADVLGRTLHVPAVTESAFGMAVLVAANATTLPKATQQLVHTGEMFLPHRGFDPEPCTSSSSASSAPGDGCLRGWPIMHGSEADELDFHPHRSRPPWGNRMARRKSLCRPH